jgi:glycerophosphoryl diester phosphodiesterase
MKAPFELQGHRGARGIHPENTLPSFEAALDLCVQSIETDLHLTKDGVPVVIHDAVITPRLCRTIDPRFGSTPRITDLTHAQLRGYIADVNPDPGRFPDQNAEVTPLARRFAEERSLDPYAIPALADLFAFAAAYAGQPGKEVGKSEAQQTAARRVCFDLELKRVPYRSENIGDGYDGRALGLFETQILAAIAEAKVMAQTRVRSFDHRCLRLIKDRSPEIDVAVLIADTAPVSPAELARAAGARIYCPRYEFVDAQVVESLHAAGVRVLPWTVNVEEDWARLIAWGVDGITTDFPDRLAAFLR